MDGALGWLDYAGGGSGATSGRQDLAEEHRHDTARGVLNSADGGGKQKTHNPPPSARSAALR